MHELKTVTTPGARYPHKAVCSCGWKSWGYLTSAAAENVGQAHVDEATLAAFKLTDGHTNEPTNKKDGYWGGVEEVGGDAAN
jgi:hypothetical protein